MSQQEQAPTIPVGAALPLARPAAKPQVLVAGLSRVGRELVRRLRANWQVIVIEKRQESVDRFRQEVGEEGISFQVGDATSLLVLQRAGAAEVQAAAATLDDDAAALEFCRLACQELDIAAVYVELLRPELAERCAAYGAEVVSRAPAMANLLLARLEGVQRTASNVGLGLGEIAEVKIRPHSAVIGQSLIQLHPQSWLVGAVYRQGKLIVPHGHTVFQSGDRVLLIGDPEVLPRIGRYFHSGFSRFPQPYGSRLCLVAPGPQMGELLGEALYLSESSERVELCLCPQGEELPAGELASYGERYPQLKISAEVKEEAPGEEESGESDLEESEPTAEETKEEVEGIEARLFPVQQWGREPHALGTFSEEEDIGCLILPSSPLECWQRWGWGENFMLRLLNQANRPCLIARGSFPYKRVVATVTPGRWRGFNLALSLVRSWGLPLVAVAVLPAELVSGQEQNEELANSLKRAQREAQRLSVQVEAVTLHGNPVHKLVEYLQEGDLLVLSHRQNRPFSLLNPDVSRHLLVRARCSVMVLPHGGRAGHLVG